MDEVGTTYVSTLGFMGREFTTTQRIVEVEPLRLIHEHNEGPMESYLRFEPDGEATRLVQDADWERPGKMPGFIKELVNKGWAERQMRQVLADFKPLAEATVPAHA